MDRRDATRRAAIVSSPFARARQTADILAVDARPAGRGRGGSPRAQTTGALAGEPYSDAATRDTIRRAYWTWQPPGGETLVEVAARAGAALDRIAAAGPVDDVLVVSHGAVMLALWRHVTGTWAEPRVVPNAGLIVVEHQSGVYAAASRVGPDGKGADPWRRRDTVA